MCLNPLFLPRQKFPIPCGKCLECQLSYSKTWAFRVCHEASLYRDNCFVTLTYNNENLPKGAFLVKKHLQDFIKRLRDRVGYEKIRYFACGEYGRRGGRPHYHIILFNYKPDDLYFFGFDKKHNKLFRSTFLEKVWPFGFVSIGNVTYDSALYTAKYMQKFNSPCDKPKPFLLQSRKPPIGCGAITSSNISTDKLYANGRYIKLPRSYINFLENKGYDLTTLKINRKKNAFRDFCISIEDMYMRKISLYNSITYDYTYDKVFDFQKYEEYINNRRKKFFSIFSKKFDVDLTPPPIQTFYGLRGEDYKKSLLRESYFIDFLMSDLSDLKDFYYQENFFNFF